MDNRESSFNEAVQSFRANYDEACQRADADYRQALRVAEKDPHAAQDVLRAGRRLRRESRLCAKEITEALLEIVNRRIAELKDKIRRRHRPPQ